MRRPLLILGLSTLLMLFLCSISNAYTYDSEIDPAVMYKDWEKVDLNWLQYPSAYFVITKNPDSAHPIQYAYFIIYRSLKISQLIGYAYYKNSQFFSYGLKCNDSGGNYALLDSNPALKKMVDNRLKKYLTLGKLEL
jgi:hypothetical protein